MSVERDPTFCSLCRIPLSSFTVATQHYAGAKHLKKERGLASLSMTTGAMIREAQPESHAAVNESPYHGEKEYFFDHNSWTGRCNVCMVELTSAQHKDQHLSGKKHKKNVLSWSASQVAMTSPPAGQGLYTPAPLTQSSNCSEESSDTWCDICKLPFTGPLPAAQHYESVKHKQKLQLNESGRKGDAVFCDVCAIYVDTHEMLELHKNSDKHQRKAAGSVLPIDSTQWLFCELCDVKCNSEEHLESHKRGAAHTKMVGRLLARQDSNATENHGSDGRAETLYQRTEGTSLSKPPGDQRLHTPPLFQSSNSYEGSSDTWCDVCKLPFTGPLPAAQHYESVKHKHKLQQLKESGGKGDAAGSLLPVDSTQWLLCELCDVKCNSEEHLESHKRGAAHTKMLGRLLARQYSNATEDHRSDERAETLYQRTERNQLGASDQGASLSTPPGEQRLHTPPVLQSANSYEGSSDTWCDICKLSFTGPLPAAQHYESVKHKHKLQLKESGGKGGAVGSLLPTDSTQWLLCELCDVKCNSAEHLESHKRGASHTKMLGRLLARQYSNATENHGSDDRAETLYQRTERSQLGASDQGASLSTPPGAQGLHTPPVFQSANSCEGSSDTWCDICKLGFTGPLPAAQHYESVKHKQKLQLKESGGKGDAVFCEVCAIFVDTREMLELHKNSERHRRKLAGPTQTVDLTQWHLCELCNVKCNSAEHLESHKKGESHTKMMQLLARQDSNARSDHGLDGDKELLFQRSEEHQQLTANLDTAQALEVVENNHVEKLARCHYQTPPSSSASQVSQRPNVMVSSNPRPTASLTSSNVGTSLDTCQVAHNVGRQEKNQLDSAIESDNTIHHQLDLSKTIIKADSHLLNMPAKEEAFQENILASVRPGESQGRVPMCSPEALVDEEPVEDRWDSSRTLVNEGDQKHALGDSPESHLNSSKTVVYKVIQKEVQLDSSKISEMIFEVSQPESEKSFLNESNGILKSQSELIKGPENEEDHREHRFGSSKGPNVDHSSSSEISANMADLKLNNAPSSETATDRLNGTCQEHALTQSLSSPRDVVDSQEIVHKDTPLVTEESPSQHCVVASCKLPTRSESAAYKKSPNIQVGLAARFELNTDSHCTDNRESSLTSIGEIDSASVGSNGAVGSSVQAPQASLDPLGANVLPLVKDKPCDDSFQGLIHTYPRLYQVEVFEKVSAADSVVFLPTGMGKTVVTAMIASHMLQNNPAHQVLILAAGLPVVVKYVEAMRKEIGSLEFQRMDSGAATRKRKVLIAGTCAGVKTVCEEPIRAQDVVITTPDHFDHLASSGQTAWQAFSLVILLNVENYLADNQLELLLERHHNSVPSEIRPKIVSFAGLPRDLHSDYEAGQFLKDLKQILGNCSIVGVKESKREMGMFLPSKEPEFIVFDRDESEKNLGNVLNEYLLASYASLAEKIGIVPCMDVEEEVSTLLCMVDSLDWALESMGDVEKSLLQHCSEVASSLSLLRNFGIGLAVGSLKNLFQEDTLNVNPVLDKNVQLYQQIIKLISGMAASSGAGEQCSGVLHVAENKKPALLLVENAVVAAQFGKILKESNDIIIATRVCDVEVNVLRKCELITVVNPRHGKHYLAQVRGSGSAIKSSVKITCNDNDLARLIERYLKSEQTLVEADDLDAMTRPTE